MAAGSSERCTSSGVIAPHAGIIMAVPMPSAKVKTSRIGAVVIPASVSTPSVRGSEQHPYLRRDQVAPPVDDIGKRTRRQRQQEYRG